MLYTPEGDGPFPALLYNHGSAPGTLSDQAFEQIGPLFAARGWVVFAPYRRGQGLSREAGPYIGNAIAAARWEGVRSAVPLGGGLLVALLVVWAVLTRGRRAGLRLAGPAVLLAVGGAAFYGVGARSAEAATVRLLETDHLDDHLAAYAWLARQPFVQPGRIATAGNSFGGIMSVLAAERVPYCAAVSGAGGAESWSRAPLLRERMVRAVGASRVPLFLFQAANDHDLSPTRVLAAEARRVGRPHEATVYPSWGTSAAEGHRFAWAGAAVWAPDVFRFLDEHCG
ncbi:MAG TPA: CocE/NonD family hydrolase [Rubricoccaceae bacterium]